MNELEYTRIRMVLQRTRERPTTDDDLGGKIAIISRPVTCNFGHVMRLYESILLPNSPYRKTRAQCILCRV